MNKTIKELLVFLLIVLLTVSIGFGIVKLFRYITEKNTGGKNKEVNITLEQKLKALIKKQIEFEYKIIKNKTVNDSFDIIKNRLTKNLSDNPYDIEILVVDSPEINALCFPGGLIVVYSGLVNLSSNPEEVAGVIAHEMGHVVYRDPLNAVIRELGIGILLTVVTGGDPNILDKIIKVVVSSKFSRDAEKRADDYSAELLIKSGINPIHLADVFKKFKEKDKILADKKYLTYINTHPDIDLRIRNVKNKAALFRGAEERFNINWRFVKSKLE